MTDAAYHWFAGHRFVVALRSPRVLVLRFELGARGLPGLAESLAGVRGVRVSATRNGLGIEAEGYRGRVFGGGQSAAWLLVTRGSADSATVPKAPRAADAASAFTTAIAGLLGCAPETARTFGSVAWHVADLLCASSEPLAGRPDPG
jgi:hypothetical protein